MRHYDVCRFGVEGTALVVVLQHDFAKALDTRVVAPVVPRPAEATLQKLAVELSIDGRPHVARIDQLAAVETRYIGRPIANVEAASYDLSKALDVLFHGF